MEIAFLIGRILFGGYFLTGAASHLINNAGMVGYASSKGVMAPKAAVVGSGLLLLIGGLSVLLGYMPLIGVITLALFLVPVSFKMHAFWKETDPMAKMNAKIQFSKNMALLGAALMLLAVQLPWAFSF